MAQGDIAIDASGVEATETEDAGAIAIDEGEVELPDLLTELQDRTQLTRRTIAKVLIESGRLDEFPLNPQRFIALVAAALERCKRDALVDGIEYRLLGEAHVHALSLFESEPLTGYLSSMRRGAAKSIHEDVPCDTPAERAFVESLEQDDAVRLYAKLPGWFQDSDAAWQLQPRLGGADRRRRRAAALFRRRIEERRRRRRSAR